MRNVNACGEGLEPRLGGGGREEKGRRERERHNLIKGEARLGSRLYVEVPTISFTVLHIDKCELTPTRTMDNMSPYLL